MTEAAKGCNTHTHTERERERERKREREKERERKRDESVKTLITIKYTIYCSFHCLPNDFILIINTTYWQYCDTSLLYLWLWGIFFFYKKIWSPDDLSFDNIIEYKICLTGFQTAIMDCSPSTHISNGNMVTKIWIVWKN